MCVKAEWGTHACGDHRTTWEDCSLACFPGMELRSPCCHSKCLNLLHHLTGPKWVLNRAVRRLGPAPDYMGSNPRPAVYQICDN